MATQSDGEDEVIEGTPDLTWAEATQLLASPRVGESDTEDEAGHVMARPASQEGEAGYPRGEVEAWMNQATRDQLDLPGEEGPAPENTSPHSTGVLDSARERLSRGEDALVQEAAPLESGERAPASGERAPASGRRAAAARRRAAKRWGRGWTRRHLWRAALTTLTARWLPVHRGSLAQALREGAANRWTAASPIHPHLSTQRL